jgi:hypothetical protein
MVVLLRAGSPRKQNKISRYKEHTLTKSPSSQILLATNNAKMGFSPKQKVTEERQGYIRD